MPLAPIRYLTNLYDIVEPVGGPLDGVAYVFQYRAATQDFLMVPAGAVTPPDPGVTYLTDENGNRLTDENGNPLTL